MNNIREDMNLKGTFYHGRKKTTTGQDFLELLHVYGVGREPDDDGDDYDD